jgi:hypothetical protein
MELRPATRAQATDVRPEPALIRNRPTTLLQLLAPWSPSLRRFISSVEKSEWDARPGAGIEIGAKNIEGAPCRTEASAEGDDDSSEDDTASFDGDTFMHHLTHSLGLTDGASTESMHIWVEARVLVTS